MTGCSYIRRQTFLRIWLANWSFSLGRFCINPCSDCCLVFKFVDLLPVRLSVRPSVYLLIRSSICPVVHAFLFFLSVHPSVCVSICLSVRLSVRLSACPSVRLSICPSVHLSACLSGRLSACPSVRLSVCPSVRLSACPPVRLSACPPVCLSVRPYVCPPDNPCFVGVCPYIHPSVHPSTT